MHSKVYCSTFFISEKDIKKKHEKTVFVSKGSWYNSNCRNMTSKGENNIYGRSKKMENYKTMEVPFEYIPPSERNEEQAAQYFQWFIEQTDNRIDILQKYIEQTNGTRIVLDKTPGSLVSLWEWFQERIEYENRDKKQLLRRMNGSEPELLKNAGIQLSNLTMAIVDDISIYLAETLIHNNKQVHWGYKKGVESMDMLNEPILFGFENNQVSVNHKNLVLVCVLRSIKKKNCLELYETYTVWKDHIR